MKQKRTKKVISYRLGHTAAEIKDRVLRFMTTFNPTKNVSNNEETYAEERIDLTLEPPRGAYSQIDHNDMTDLAGAHTGGGLALSQYYQGP
jgi:flagellar biosynthesis GTPase FlhF